MPRISRNSNQTDVLEDVPTQIIDDEKEEDNYYINTPRSPSPWTTFQWQISPATKAKMKELDNRLIVRRTGQKFLQKIMAKKFANLVDAYMRIQLGRSLVHHLAVDWPHTFFRSLKSIRYLKKDSASDSLCFMGKIKLSPSVSRAHSHENGIQKIIHRYLAQEPYHVFVKIVQEYQESDWKFKEIEPHIYEKVVNKMVFEHLSPHFMLYLTRGSSCLLRELRERPHGNVYQKLKKVFPQAKDTTVFHTMVLESAGSKQTLSDFLHRMKFTWQMGDLVAYMKYMSQLLVILFQLFYTLVVMDEQQVTHYDLHFNNIFVLEPNSNVSTKHSQESLAVYLVDHDLAVLVNDEVATIRIFDWDYGYEAQCASHLNVNSRAEYACPQWGVCDSHNPRFDLHKVIDLLCDYGVLPIHMENLLEKVYLQPNSTDPNINPLLRRNRLMCDEPTCWSDTLCHLDVENDEYVCKGEWFKSNVIKSARDFLCDDFLPWVNDPPKEFYWSVWNMFDIRHPRQFCFDDVPRLTKNVAVRYISGNQNRIYFDPNYLPADVLTRHIDHPKLSQMRNLWNNKVFSRTVAIKNTVHRYLQEGRFVPTVFSMTDFDFDSSE